MIPFTSRRRLLWQPSFFNAFDIFAVLNFILVDRFLQLYLWFLKTPHDLIFERLEGSKFGLTPILSCIKQNSKIFKSFQRESTLSTTLQRIHSPGVVRDASDLGRHQGCFCRDGKLPGVHSRGPVQGGPNRPANVQSLSRVQKESGGSVRHHQVREMQQEPRPSRSQILCSGMPTKTIL